MALSQSGDTTTAGEKPPGASELYEGFLPSSLLNSFSPSFPRMVMIPTSSRAPRRYLTAVRNRYHRLQPEVYSWIQPACCVPFLSIRYYMDTIYQEICQSRFRCIKSWIIPFHRVLIVTNGTDTDGHRRPVPACRNERPL